jgi:hypothetical protein
MSSRSCNVRLEVCKLYALLEGGGGGGGLRKAGAQRRGRRSIDTKQGDDVCHWAGSAGLEQGVVQEKSKGCRWWRVEGAAHTEGVELRVWVWSRLRHDSEGELELQLLLRNAALSFLH